MKTIKIEPHKSSLGMDANISVLLMYIGMAVISWIPYLGWIAWAAPLVIFFMEKNSKFVKFQAVQALIIGIVRAVLSILFSIIIWALTPRFNNLNDWVNLGRNAGIISFIGVIATIIGLAFMALIIYVVIMAYGYKQVELPIIGAIANKASGKLDDIGKSFKNNQNGQSSQQSQQPSQQNDDNKNNNL